MPTGLLRSVRFLGVIVSVAFIAQGLQPRLASAQTYTYTLTKVASQGYDCTTGTPASFGHNTTAAPNQCVTFTVSVKNDTGSGAPITSLSVTDLLPPGLNPGAASCSTNPGGSACSFTPATAGNSGTFTFTSGAGYMLPAGSTQSFSFVAQIPSGTACGSSFVNSLSAGSVTATGNAGATTFTYNATTSNPTATVGVVCGAGGAGGSPGLFIQKTADGYSCPVSQGCVANVGDTILYQLSYGNSSTTTATGVIVVDTLSAGQSVIAVSPGCAVAPQGNGTTIVTCNEPNIPGGTGPAAAVAIRVRVTGSASPITDTATVSATNFATATSNTTYVAVGAAYGTCGYNPCGTCGYNPCGTCGYNACGTCGTSACGTCGYNPCGTCGASACGTCGYNPCGTCGTSTCGTCGYNPCGTCGTTACGGCGFSSCNPCGFASCSACAYGTCGYGANVVCGVVTAYSPAGPVSTGAVTLNGVTYPIAAGTVFNGVVVVPGNYYCFVVGVVAVTGCLSGIPTGVTTISHVHQRPAWRRATLGAD